MPSQPTGPRVGILTLPLGNNYGGVAQAWALQRAITQLGCSAATVDRQWSIGASAKRRLKTRYGATRRGRLGGPATPSSELRSFMAHNMVLTRPVRSTRALAKMIEESQFEIVVVGSDQVWQPAFAPSLDEYALHVPDTHQRFSRIAYGASFGSSVPSKEQAERLSAALRNFSVVTVREESGQRLCADLLDIEADVVADPTLLIAADEYRDVYRNSHSATFPTSGTLVTYFLDPTPHKRHIARRLAAEYDLKLTSAYHHDRSAGIVFNPRYRSFADWLATIDTAEFVLTDSYHGMLMSLLFRRPFLAVSNPERGADRFISILSVLGLEDRVIQSDAEMCGLAGPIDSAAPLDYSRALDRFILESKLRLAQSIHG